MGTSILFITDCSLDQQCIVRREHGKAKMRAELNSGAYQLDASWQREEPASRLQDF
jgi:hypothetical protein